MTFWRGCLVLIALATFSPHAGDAAAPCARTWPPGDSDYGAYLAAACKSCHHAAADAAGVPAIAGVSAPVLACALAEYRSGRRENAVMQTLAARLTDTEIVSLAAYFARLGTEEGDE